MIGRVRLCIGESVLCAIAGLALGFALNGFLWPGSKPRVPLYVSTSLEGIDDLGEVMAVISDAGRDTDVWELGNLPDDIRRAVNRIRTFLRK